ncbi:MAG: 4Fe-4S binding protein [Chloroflexi bacterium]|nr:4Fe-4S binding protein [Chloroflexota bacterium]
MASIWIPEPTLDEEKCNGCGTCVALCHTAALEMADGKAAIARPEDCDYCGACEENCPEGAIGCPYEIVLG